MQSTKPDTLAIAAAKVGGIGANNVTIGGDGTLLREFLHVADLARACLLLIDKYDNSIAINVGNGQEISILDLATLVVSIGIAKSCHYSHAQNLLSLSALKPSSRTARALAATTPVTRSSAKS